MGNAHSSSEKEENKSPSLTESHNSARNVLEGFAKGIKDDIYKNANKKGSSLKGNLKDAKFYHDFSTLRKIPRSPCDLNFWFHTNVWKDKAYERDPCYGRQEKNNSNLEGAVCTNSKIKGNENKINDTGACAPYRRRELCDYNLEHLNDRNVLNTHDLLGNVLVMAKNEGASIVNSQANNGTLNVCTAIARSFADIGDIIRGRDLYLGKNESEKNTKKKLQENLEKIFEKIRNSDRTLINVSIEQVREYWWALNRKDVWKALTCNAPNEAQYFIKSDASNKSFSNENCGHNKNGDPLTNLDYVPQFLRWFEEWAEHFCLVRKHKLEKVKEACRGKKGEMYCSHNGYDCTKSIGKIRHFIWDSKCTGCLVECSLYDSWLKNQRNEFEKQKEKYEKEINENNSLRNNTNNSINNKYYKEFYDKLKNGGYQTVNKFTNLLNEGRYCKQQITGEKDIDFTNTDEKWTFSHSKHCKVCPYCGVVCNNGTCTAKQEIYPNCENNEAYSPDDAKTTEINVIVSGNEQGDITKRLEDFCTNGTNEKGKNYQKWECYYKSIQDNKCKMEINGADRKFNNKITSFDGFFDLWVKNLFRDTINWNDKIKTCMNNTKSAYCNDGCNSNCVCFDKWVKQKEGEWNSIKELFTKKGNIPQKYYLNINELFDSYFFQVMNEFNQDETKWNQLKENLKKKIESSKKKEGTKDSEAAIELLLEHLKEKSTICKDNNTIEGCDSTVDSKTNPCGKNTEAGSDKVVSIKQIAQYYKRLAHAQLEERGGGRSALKGDASKGDYKRGGSPDGFKGDKLCTITKDHSNAHSQSKEPSANKGQDRFKIGEQWKSGSEIKMSDTHGYMPPRRQHMCTSNLEHLQTSNTGISNSSIASHSLLGDVLLSAKYEAQKIKDLYSKNNSKERLNDQNDKESLCRAMKYSFADLGDIIRGRDMWDKDCGSQKMEGNLVEIFKKIKEGLSKDIKDKYKGDNDKNKYLNLRSDWWEANRDQIWKAMQCPTTTPKSGSVTCDSDHTPLDDYIPQRLRWMTEWAEWYCKMQKKAYKELEEKCRKCKEKNNGEGCTKDNGNGDCTNCKDACEKYKNKIEPWKQQWTKIKDKYLILYNKAEIYAINGGPKYYTTHMQKEDKPVIEFLFELYKENGGKVGPPPSIHGSMRVSEPLKEVSTDDRTPTVYSTAAGYVHQELRNMGCKEQNVFCENSGKDTNYAFREKPHDHDEACGCKDRNPQPPAPVPKKEEKPCDIVKRHLKNNDETHDIQGCNQKYKDGKDKYPGWDCEKNIDTNHAGACMPPRRQKLCVYFIADKNVTDKIQSQDNLREAFIKCAAAETFLAWEKYKEDKKNEQNTDGGYTPDLDNELKSGKLPDDFKRQIFYTYGDFRDFLFGTDISQTHGKGSDLGKKIDSLFPENSGDNSPDKLSRDKWWEVNGPQIWESMLCALEKRAGNKEELTKKYSYSNVKFSGENSPTLEKFAKRPQFLRWMTEWGEHFCKERKGKMKKLVDECEECRLSDSDGTCEKNGEGCQKCTEQCKKYQEWLTDWKSYYDNQKKKFLRDKTSRTYDNDPGATEAKNASDAREYLDKQLQKICSDKNGDCEYKCMKDVSTQSKEKKSPVGSNDSMPASLDDEPEEVQGKCSCTPPPDACTIVKDLFEKKDENDKYFNEACSLKYQGKKEKHTQWKCTNKTKNGEKGQEGEVCIPPRRQKLYLKKIEELTNGATPHQLRKAFIESAAVETFFSWHKFKKEKIKEKKENENGLNNFLNGLFGGSNDDEEKEETSTKLENKLKEGDIPEEFKRQMFYTLGDYRDILFGKDISGDSKIEDVKKVIDSVFPNSGDKKTPNGQSRDAWWSNYAKNIWQGMLCALTYKENGKTVVKNSELDDSKLLENGNDYESVTIAANETEAINPGESNINAGKGTHLSEFVKRPTYFRWLEEWGEEFCGTRKRMLEKIKEECRSDIPGHHYCSGDGYDCTAKELRHHKMFAHLDCQSCEKACTKYKKWIQKKGKEFEEQKSKYYGELDKLKKANSNGGNTCCEEIEKHTSTANFLAALKHCKPGEADGSDQDNKLDFENPQNTFNPSTYCKTCPLNGVTIDRNGEYKPKNANKQNITEGHPTDINILINDGATYGTTDTTENELMKNCPTYELYKDLKKHKWKCQKKNDEVHECNLNGADNSVKSKYFEKQIPFKVLLERWLIDFIDYYNKSKEVITRCTNRGENKCECVKEWLNQKSTEWGDIKKYYEEYFKDDKETIASKIKSFLEQGPFESLVEEAKKIFDNNMNEDDMWGCTDPDNCSKKKKQEDKDFISNLISKLKTKTTSCQTKHSVDTQPRGQTTPPRDKNQSPCEEPPLDNNLFDDDDNEKTGDMKPQFCPKEVVTPKENTPEKKIEKDACDIVKDHFLIYKNGNGENGINGCHPKGGEFKWKCDDDHFVEGEVGCIPPRRQKLCIHDLKVLTNTSSEEDLREAFINCAAKEIHFSWLYYKNKNGSSVETQLQSGKIPDDFKSIMYYTFGDYRDICFGKDISSDPNIYGISQKVNDILNRQNGKTRTQKVTPETWWEKHGPHIWKGMLCALQSDKNKGKLESIPPPEHFSKRLQFLRWFVEWGDEYCHKRGELEKKVKQSCKEINAGHKEKNNSSCAESCKEYNEYVTKKKEEYDTQKDKFQSDKNQKKPGYDNILSEGVSDYLKEKCLHKKCDCMKKVKDTKNYWDEPFETYDDNSLKSNCNTAISEHFSPSQKGKMSCVEQIAKELREKAEKNVEKIDSSMKGNGRNNNGNCNLIKKQTDNNGKTTCDFNKRYPNGITSLDSSCDNNGKKRFKIEEEWDCDEKTFDGKNKLCIPPRRRDMCLNKLKNIKDENISDSKTLLVKIQDVAKNEGDDIIRNLLPDNPCNESVICDAMKYSFADIGDIIRGRSKIKPNNDDNIEKELQNIFRKIQNTINTSSSSLKNMDLTEFREKWWDANRKEVWKAMTCKAPNDAHLKKKLNNPGNKSQIIATQTEQTKKCRHDSEPPDYDYIPERYRFLQEWSEYLCKVLKEKTYEMKNNCEQCNTQNGTCEDNKNDSTCKKCKIKCDEYKKIVDKWQSQFEEQNEIYKQLYMNAKTAGTPEADNDSSIKFLKKLEDSCADPHSADKYLDKSTHCTEYLYPKSNSSASNYAFSPYPKDYKDKCKCKEKPTGGPDNNLTSFIQNSLNFPKIPGLKKVTKIVPRLPVPIIDLIPDAHTIHKIVAESLESIIPKFHAYPDKTDVPSPTNNILNEVLPSAIPVGIALALGSIAFLYLKKKPKSPVDLLRVIDIHKGEYGMPTKLSSNRYIPYRSGSYKGKSYIYIEGDTDEEKYIGDITSSDITSSESEYEELDSNDIYPYQSPKYKTLIEVVLEPSKTDTQNDIPSDNTSNNKLTDEEWNELKQHFISQYLPNTEPNNNYRSGNSPTNTNNTTTSHDNMGEKPFIMSIHDRNLYTGEEISYNINMSTNTNNDIPKYLSNNVYSGIDLINDTLSGNKHIDIYDEVLKRKENELFGTNHVKQTSTHSIAKNTYSDDPITNQINLFHKWLDRHRDMCEKWDKNNKVEILDKLNEEWNKDSDEGDIYTSNGNRTLNTDVSIEIDMDNPKPINQFSNMDTNVDTPTMDNMEDDIYYDVNDDDNNQPSVDDITMDHNRVDVPKKVHVEIKILNNTSNGSLQQKFPISDVWNI
ncbi:erythrocyte membrane protein 1, PfEMP1 [Plasmodium reichenowi]|uniref:Erythrocyte membrane protein 1, PfEMP1 n=1 Tax=Plasmodium reichenowi TaxID=5854 RepID=A0A2P9DCM9_PLARE|nr:erythrocyte membrane protein 1, PfEMP1 [Plasmodium reichenowi]